MYHNIGSLPHFDAPPIFITRLTSVIIIFLIVVSVSVAKIVWICHIVFMLWLTFAELFFFLCSIFSFEGLSVLFI